MSDTTTKKPASRGSKKSTSRLGTKMRGKLQAKYDARGGSLAGLYNLYSLKNNADVVVVGDLLFLNYLMCESDPDVVRINYAPSNDLITAEVLHTGGRLELRYIRSSEDVETENMLKARERLVAEYEARAMTSLGSYVRVWQSTWTEQELIPGYEFRLRNWHRILPWYEQAQFHSLAHMERKFTAHMHDHGRTDMRQLLTLEETEGQTALLIAAAIRAVATGDCESDLSSATFGLNTRFFLRGRQ